MCNVMLTALRNNGQQLHFVFKYYVLKYMQIIYIWLK